MYQVHLPNITGSLDVNNIYVIPNDDIPDKQTHTENRRWQDKGAVAL